MLSHSDVLIVGGGPIGASLALAISGAGVSVSLVEARTAPADDARTIAVSHGTALMLKRLGVSMASLQATPIESIHVSQRGGFGRTILRSSELKLPALGYVVSYAALSTALEEALPASGVSVTYGAKADLIKSTAAFGIAQVTNDAGVEEVTARLIVLADGGRNVDGIPGIIIKEQDYHQSAVVALLSTEPPARAMAYERFTTTGPVALLPYKGRYALIWTTSPEEALTLAGLGSAMFLERLQQHLGVNGLRFTTVESRATFPLRLRVANSPASQRIALVGNAAQALHPVAGQGFNLGIRDVEALAKCIRECDRESLGGSVMLARYRALRRWDATGGIAVTDFLVRGFANDSLLMRAGRGFGLAALDFLPPARKWFARKMMFGISG
ncbi:MAG TPA: FAD-dependent monooxygenase [Burkholderiales bacterium]|nr:FAD-dependent monooxygenase [Burkholderiales bacterium]